MASQSNKRLVEVAAPVKHALGRPRSRKSEKWRLLPELQPELPLTWLRPMASRVTWRSVANAFQNEESDWGLYLAALPDVAKLVYSIQNIRHIMV